MSNSRDGQTIMDGGGVDGGAGPGVPWFLMLALAVLVPLSLIVHECGRHASLSLHRSKIVSMLAALLSTLGFWELVAVLMWSVGFPGADDLRHSVKAAATGAVITSIIMNLTWRSVEAEKNGRASG